AVTVALQKADPTKPLKILTDSQYVVNSVTDWIKNWRKRDYDQVQNSAYFKDLDREFHKRTGETEIAYVKAHDGLAGNEAADILAKDGAARYVRK
ncbi:ribonuclease H-like domain-containing protein, partial [Blastocladiella britannica]